MEQHLQQQEICVVLFWSFLGAGNRLHVAPHGGDGFGEVQVLKPSGRFGAAKEKTNKMRKKTMKASSEALGKGMRGINIRIR